MATDYVRALPRSLATQVLTLSGYVFSIIEDEARRLKEKKPPREVIGSIQLAALAFELRLAFETGTKTAQTAIAECEDLGVPGFMVGHTLFQGRSPEVLLGKKLAQQLRAQLPERLVAVMDQATTVREFVLLLFADYRHGSEAST